MLALSKEYTEIMGRLAHFEKHQLEQGDEYGAEVLHHAQKRIAQLEAVKETAVDLLDALENNPPYVPEGIDLLKKAIGVSDSAS